MKTREPTPRMRLLAGSTESFLRAADDRLFGSRKRRYAELLGQLILPGCRTVLDVGCGANASLLNLVPSIPYSVGVDLVLPPGVPVDHSSRHDEYRQIDVRSLSEHFASNSYDCVVALDLIEHLSREDGDALLRTMESVASKRVIVFTPNGFLFQPPAPDNPYQEHVSGWDVDDFERLGYRVFGVNGWRPLRGTYALPRWSPSPFWGRVSLSTQSFFEPRPRRAFQLLCAKDLPPASQSVSPP